MTKTITILAAFAALTTTSAFGSLSDHVNLGALLQPTESLSVKQSGPPSKRGSLARSYENDAAPAVIDNAVDNATSGVVGFFKNIDLGAIAHSDTEAPQANTFRYRRGGRV